MKLKQKFKTVGLGLALSAATTFGKAQSTPDLKASDAKTDNTEIKTDNPTQNDSIKASFTAEQLAIATSQTGLNKEESEAFIDSYLNNLDDEGLISVKGFINIISKAKLNKNQAEDILHILTTLGKSNENNHPSQEKVIKGQGYNFGNYNIDFSINKDGEIASMDLNTSNKSSFTKEIKEINDAICRHTGKAVDRSGGVRESSMLIYEVLIYKIIQEKEKQGLAVSNADQYKKRFHKKLQDNGLEFGSDGKLHGIEANLNKPLKTKRQLEEEFIQKRQQEFNAYRSGGR